MCNELNLNGDASLDPSAPHACRFDQGARLPPSEEAVAAAKQAAASEEAVVPMKPYLDFGGVPHGSLIFLITVIKESHFDCEK